MDTSWLGLWLGNAIQDSKTILSRSSPDEIAIIVHKVMSIGKIIVVKQFIGSNESQESFLNG